MHFEIIAANFSPLIHIEICGGKFIKTKITPWYPITRKSISVWVTNVWEKKINFRHSAACHSLNCKKSPHLIKRLSIRKQPSARELWNGPHHVNAALKNGKIMPYTRACWGRQEKLKKNSFRSVDNRKNQFYPLINWEHANEMNTRKWSHVVSSSKLK